MTMGVVTEVQVHRVYIKADIQTVWDSITDSEWNGKYGYRTPGEYELRPGGAYRVRASKAMLDHGAPDTIIVGEILEVEPPHRLVQTWHATFAENIAAEPATRLTWELSEEYGVTKVTVTHELGGATETAAYVGGQISDAGGGWDFILSDLKTLLETGKPFTG